MVLAQRLVSCVVFVFVGDVYRTQRASPPDIHRSTLAEFWQAIHQCNLKKRITGWRCVDEEG